MPIPVARDPEVTRTALEAWLAGYLGAPVAVTDLAMAAQGNSNETSSFTATWADADGEHREEMILRAQPEGYHLFLGNDVLFQWRMMEAVARHGAVPLPRLWFAEPGRDVLGVPFYVMGRVAGRAAADHPPYNSEGWLKDLDPARRRRAWTNGLDCLAALHRIDWHDGFEFLDDPTRGTPGLDQILTHQEASLVWAAAGRPQPTTDVAMAWLREHQPADAPVAVLWGDARPGNLLYADDQSIAAVLDWEMASLGPPEADLGWWLFMDRFWAEGFGLERLDGLPTRDETVEYFAAALGRPLGDVRYYEALGALRMAIILIRAFDLMIEEGGLPPDTPVVTDNPATNILADVLGLPLPGVSADLFAAVETSATVDRPRG